MAFTLLRAGLLSGIQKPQAEKASIGGIPKRSLDVSLSVAIGILVLPLLAFVALLIFLESGRPILIRHRRIGAAGRKFDCLKFRTMVQNADEVLIAHLASNCTAQAEWESTRKLKCDPRITPFGAILRKTSIDELPQLINVLRGEMSLIGPRPIVDAEVHWYGDAFQHYIRARPGISGAWQVSGRSDIPYADRVRLDVAYVENWSLIADARIFFRTVAVVLTARGSY